MSDIFKSQWGLTFGGGGAKGSAHIGVVKYLQDNGFEPHAITGNSIGSFIAAMYAFKFTHQEMKEAFLGLEPFKLSFLRPTQFGVMKNSSLYNVLTNHFGKKTRIENSHIPLGIHTTNIVTGKPHPIYSGNLIDAVMSSCCVPGLYIPTYTEEEVLVDGGLTENVPISLLKNFNVEKIVAINLNGHTNYSRPRNVMDVLANSFDIAIDHTTRTQLKEADKVLDLDLSEYNRFVIGDVDNIISLSYDLMASEFS